MPPEAAAGGPMRAGALGAGAAAGSLAGAVVGYVPGVSAAIAAVAAMPAVPRESADRGFVVATSGANTANTIWAPLRTQQTKLPGTDRQPPHRYPALIDCRTKGYSSLERRRSEKVWWVATPERVQECRRSFPRV